MSVIGEFTVPAEALALRQSFERVPDLEIEIERLATHSREWVMPFLWASADDIVVADDALRADPSIDELEALDTVDDVREYSVVWSPAVQQLVDEMVNRHGIMQEAEAARDTWYLKLKFVDREYLTGFQNHFRHRGYQFELQRLTDGKAPKQRAYDLTPEQREVLVLALERGYFSVPRETQSQVLAEELGISANACSQRLRRAMANLTANTLTIAAYDRDDS